MSPEELLAWLAGQSAEAKRRARQHQDNDYMFGTYCGQAEAYTATAQRVSRLLHPSNKVAPPVEAGTTHPQLPGDGRTGGEAPSSSPPVVSYVPATYTCPQCGEASMHLLPPHPCRARRPGGTMTTSAPYTRIETVQAVRLTRENAAEVVTWLRGHGDARDAWSPPGGAWVAWYGHTDYSTSANLGDWIVVNEINDITVYTDEGFEAEGFLPPGVEWRTT